MQVICMMGDLIQLDNMLISACFFPQNDMGLGIPWQIFVGHFWSDIFCTHFFVNFILHDNFSLCIFSSRIFFIFSFFHRTFFHLIFIRVGFLSRHFSSMHMFVSPIFVHIFFRPCISSSIHFLSLPFFLVWNFCLVFFVRIFSSGHFFD